MAKEYEDLTDKEKAHYDKWTARGDKFTKAGQGMQQGGGKMMGCGCLLILFVTIPIILIAFFLL